MSEKETIDKVREKQSLMSKLQDILMFGKGTREDLKELDKQLRGDYHGSLLDQRHRWAAAYRETLEAEQASLGKRFKTVIQSYDRVMAQVNRASYGYAPLFHRTGQVESAELARAFNHDRDIGEYLDRIGEAADAVSQSVMASDWRSASEGVDKVREMLDEFERKWKNREKAFRSGEV